MSDLRWKRTEVGRFPLFVEPNKTVIVTVLSPGAMRVASKDGETLSPQAALIELCMEPSTGTLVIYPPDAVRLSTLLVDALPVAEEHDHGTALG